MADMLRASVAVCADSRLTGPRSLSDGKNMIYCGPLMPTSRTLLTADYTCCSGDSSRSVMHVACALVDGRSDDIS